MSYLLLRNSSGVHATWMNVSSFHCCHEQYVRKIPVKFFCSFLFVNWLGLIAIFSNTSFSILVLNYILLSVFVICLLSVIFRNGKCAVYLNSRQVYLEKKFETKNIWKQTWTFDFVTAFSFLVTSILGFFFLFKNIDIYFRLMYKYNVCSVDFQISWCSLEFIHIYILVYMYMYLLILIYIWISFENS